MPGITASEIAPIRAMKRDLYRYRADVYRVPDPVGGVQTGVPARIATNVRCNGAPGGGAAVGGAVSLGISDQNAYQWYVEYGVDVQPGDEIRPTTGMYTGQIFNVASVAPWETETVCGCTKEEA